MKNNSKKTKPVTLDMIEERTRNWMNMKYDILGIPMDEEIRNKLFDIDMAIFMNQYLFRTLRYEQTKKQLSDAFEKSGVDTILEKKYGK